MKKAPRLLAQKPSKCPMCNRTIHKGTFIMKDFETGWWVHPKCLAEDMERSHGVNIEAVESVQLIRDAVIDAVKCPKCRAARGAPCREMGRERAAVHRQRVILAGSVSSLVVPSV